MTVTSDAFGLMEVTELRCTTTMNNLNKHGKNYIMVSKKIQELSFSDLDLIERLLAEEFARVRENSDNPNHSQQVLRVMNAIRAQKNISVIGKW